jgi:hypothetical protein
MRVLSFDVGIRNLAGCIIEWNESSDIGSNLKIHYWDIINVVDNKKSTEAPSICLSEGCKLKPKSYIDFNKIKYCFCTKHLKDSQSLTTNVFEPYSTDNFTEIIQTDSIYCVECEPTTPTTKPTKRIKCLYTNSKLQTTLCNKHYKQITSRTETARKKIISFSKSKVKDMTTNDLKLQLIKCLDSRKDILLKNVDMVLIENQPTFKNPTMKSVSDTIYTWFMIRGVIDAESNGSTIKEVKFISPSNKLKEFNTETIDEAVDNQKYKITKQLAIENTKTILASYKLDESINRILSFDKKDDLADSFLQGWYVLNSMHDDKLYAEWQLLYKEVKLDTTIKPTIEPITKKKSTKKKLTID